MPPLPPEIFSRIGQYVEHQDLVNLTAVSRAHRAEAERLLYRDVRLTLKGSHRGRAQSAQRVKSLNTVVACLDRLASSETLASLVRSFSFQSDNDSIGAYQYDIHDSTIVTVAHALAAALPCMKNVEHFTLLAAVGDSGAESEDGEAISEPTSPDDEFSLSIRQSLVKCRFPLKTATLHANLHLVDWVMSHPSLVSLHIVRPSSLIEYDRVYGDLTCDQVRSVRAALDHPNHPHLFYCDSDGETHHVYILPNPNRTLTDDEWELVLRQHELRGGNIEAISVIVDHIDVVLPLIRLASGQDPITIMIQIKHADPLPDKSAFIEAIGSHKGLSVLQIIPWSEKLAPGDDWADTDKEDKLSQFIEDCSERLPNLEEGGWHVGHATFL